MCSIKNGLNSIKEGESKARRKVAIKENLAQGKDEFRKEDSGLVLSIFDRDDLSDVYQLVMDRYKDEIPEGFDRVLWGDLMIMFNPSDEDEFWNSQQDWNVVSWKLHGSSGLESEEDSTMALELIRFVKKLIAELEHENSDGDEEDL
ncbi:hypothetical protein Tco_1419139 [Tanacetum coccineum]